MPSFSFTMRCACLQYPPRGWPIWWYCRPDGFVQKSFIISSEVFESGCLWAHRPARLRMVDECPGYSNTLALASRKFVRFMFHPILQANFCQLLSGPSLLVSLCQCRHKSAEALHSRGRITGRRLNVWNTNPISRLRFPASWSSSICSHRFRSVDIYRLSLCRDNQLYSSVLTFEPEALPIMAIFTSGYFEIDWAQCVDNLRADIIVFWWCCLIR